MMHQMAKTPQIFTKIWTRMARTFLCLILIQLIFAEKVARTISVGLSNESFKERRTPNQSSSANGRAGPEMDSARPFDELELNPKRIKLGRSPSWTSPVRRTAELDQLKPVFASSS
ncbi:hypothetical protein F2Q69_00029586 [Brassica cretica]|uniref:Uncharacterized protein n=1 Tax=Brassica cretica TaxID=69181 RepID=A0A8S9S2R5_BRACR|nr:hypothetical protein F2Q69_00029586 [Brassica cretica]